MKSVVNKSRKPIRIPLPGGGVLHLGPAKSGQIADQHADLPAIRKLIEAGTIVLSGDDTHPDTGNAAEGHVHSATHGRGPRTIVRPSGDR